MYQQLAVAGKQAGVLPTVVIEDRLLFVCRLETRHSDGA